MRASLGTEKTRLISVIESSPPERFAMSSAFSVSCDLQERCVCDLNLGFQRGRQLVALKLIFVQRHSFQGPGVRSSGLLALVGAVVDGDDGHGGPHPLRPHNPICTPVHCHTPAEP